MYQSSVKFYDWTFKLRAGNLNSLFTCILLHHHIRPWHSRRVNAFLKTWIWFYRIMYQEKLVDSYMFWCNSKKARTTLLKELLLYFIGCHYKIGSNLFHQNVLVFCSTAICKIDGWYRLIFAENALMW